jgi:L-glyceraldehyde 3-phosphate reductase
MDYQPEPKRYEHMNYRRCGRSGLLLPMVSLGLWHNFGADHPLENSREMLRGAFDLGITHFDLANNYGFPSGTAEETFGRILKKDFRPYRDELVISSKAGYDMWSGPYGNWGSRKYLIASCDQSLKRMGLDYVDIFYHHRPDPETPLEETMGALSHIVKSGRALYAGISRYNADLTGRAATMMREMGTPLLIHQPNYNFFKRWIEGGLLTTLEAEGLGCIVFSPMAQGLLSGRYLEGVPADSRAGQPHTFLKPSDVTDELVQKLTQLNAIAQARQQSLAQMAIAWVLRQTQVTSALIGASRLSQIKDCVAALEHLDFTPNELARIDEIIPGDLNYK